MFDLPIFELIRTIVDWLLFVVTLMTIVLTPILTIATLIVSYLRGHPLLYFVTALCQLWLYAVWVTVNY